MSKWKMKQYRALVEIKGKVEEVPVWAESLETALEAANLEYGSDKVTRVRPVVAPDISRFERVE